MAPKWHLSNIHRSVTRAVLLGVVSVGLISDRIIACLSARLVCAARLLRNPLLSTRVVSEMPIAGRLPRPRPPPSSSIPVYRPRRPQGPNLRLPDRPEADDAARPSHRSGHFGSLSYYFVSTEYSAWWPSMKSVRPPGPPKTRSIGRSGTSMRPIAVPDLSQTKIWPLAI